MIDGCECGVIDPGLTDARMGATPSPCLWFMTELNHTYWLFMDGITVDILGCHLRKTLLA